jgi:microcystin-dependent protein
MLADGRALQRSSYPDLFTALGGTSSPWGLPDSNTFNIPDLRSRMLVAASAVAPSGLTARALAAASGAEGITLDATMIPGHSHNFNVNSGYVSSDHSHTYSGTTSGRSTGHLHGPLSGSNYIVGGGSAQNIRLASGTAFTGSTDATTNADDRDHSHTFSGTSSGISANHYHNVAGGTDNGSGGGGSHNNMPPWCAVAMIIKVLGTSINPGGALQGATGQRGAIWYMYNGAGTPAAGTFVGELDGDWAIRKSDGENFQRVGGVWVDQGFTNRSTATTTAARAYRVAALSTTASAAIKVPLDGLDFDVSSNLFNSASGRFNIPTAGSYQIDAQVMLNPGGGVANANTTVEALIYVNGAQRSGGTRVSNVDNQGYACSVATDVLRLNAGDYVELYVYATSAWPLGPINSTTWNSMAVALITAGSGPQGARGAQWWTYAGTGTPASNAFPTAIVNDLCVRTSDTEVFALTASGWVDQGYKAGGSIASTPVVAKARRNGGVSCAAGWNRIPMDTLVFDTVGSIANTSAGRLVAPYMGYYQINAQAGESGAVELLMFIAVGGSAPETNGFRGTRYSGAGNNNGVAAGHLYLNAGDAVDLWVWVASACTLSSSNPDMTWMTMALAQPGVGPQGTRWFSYSGAGVPPANTFTGETDGDMAIRTSDSEVFKRISGAWVDQNWKMAAGVNQTASAARMYRSAAFTPAANAWTKIPLDTVSFDTTGAGMASVANGRINILTDGLYQVDANVFQNVSATGTYTNYGVQVAKNGVTFLQNYNGPAIATYSGMAGSDKVQCKAGDYLELYIASSQSAALNTGLFVNYLSVALIAAGPGPQGQRGSNWFTYTGAGTPAAGTFTGELNGDMAVRASDGEVFTRVAGAWVDQNWKQSTGMATMDAMHIVGNPNEPAFQNGWVNYDIANFNPCGFRKYPDGKVRLKGLIKSGTVGGPPIFNLPPGYRPVRESLHEPDNVGSIADLRVRMNGDVCLNTGSNGWLSLDEVEFDTETVTTYAVGTRGSNWFAYSGAGTPPTPSFTSEIDNDMAVRTSDSEVFKRIAGIWTDQSYKAGSTLTTIPTVAAKAYLAGAFTTTNAMQKVPLDTLAFDVSNNLWDATNKRFVCPASGVYHVDANLAWGASSWSGRCLVAVYKNGLEVLRTDGYRTSDASDFRTFTFSDEIRCNQGDYLELYAWSAVGFSLQTSSGIMSFLSVALINASQGPQGPPGPGPGGAVQRNPGKYTGYNTMSGTANILDGAGGGGAGSPLTLTITPTVPSWWEVNFNCSNILALTAAYYYTQLQMNLSPADLDGLSIFNGSVITQHSQVQQYEGRTFMRKFRLAAGQSYTMTPALATSGGSYQYYTAPTHLWIEGKLWPQ